MGRGGGTAAAAPGSAPGPAAEGAKAAGGEAAVAGEAKKAASAPSPKGGGDNAPRRQLETLVRSRALLERSDEGWGEHDALREATGGEGILLESLLAVQARRTSGLKGRARVAPAAV